MSLLYTASFKELGSLLCLWHDAKLRKTQLEVRLLNPRPAAQCSVHSVMQFDFAGGHGHLSHV